MRWCRKMLGRYRLAWRFCPSCNSDAPYVDTCKICEGCRSLAGDIHMLEIRKVWMRFEDSDFYIAKRR